MADGELNVVLLIFWHVTPEVMLFQQWMSVMKQLLCKPAVYSTQNEGVTGTFHNKRELSLSFWCVNITWLGICLIDIKQMNDFSFCFLVPPPSSVKRCPSFHQSTVVECWPMSALNSDSDIMTGSVPSKQLTHWAEPTSFSVNDTCFAYSSKIKN